MSKAQQEVKEQRTAIPLEEANAIADEMIIRLQPYCERIQVAGSIRRQKPTVNDIDIVLIPADVPALVAAIHGAGNAGGYDAKIHRTLYKKVAIDIYVANIFTWSTLLLIRTGSVAHNIRLCTIAKRKNWTLKANGDGLMNETGQRIAGETERSIFDALGIPYVAPQHRG